MIAPTALCARDFAPTPLELYFASMIAVVLDVLGLSSEIVSSPGSSCG